MMTDRFVNLGKKVTDHLAPINATLFIGTGVLVPLMDFVRPHFAYMSQVTGVVVFLFLALLAFKLFTKSSYRLIPGSLVLSAGVCAAAFTVGAVASARHAKDGGYMAATSDDAKALQKSMIELEEKLKRIESGKSDDPRIELVKLNLSWDQSELHLSARRGDLRAVELYLKAGMSIYLIGNENNNSLGASIIKGNYPRMKDLLLLLEKYGHSMNQAGSVQDKLDPKAPPNLYALAKEIHNEEAATLMESMGADTKTYESWKARQPPPAKPAYLYGI